MKATPGIEPGNKSFADFCLTAWLCRRSVDAVYYTTSDPGCQGVWQKYFIYFHRNFYFLTFRESVFRTPALANGIEVRYNNITKAKEVDPMKLNLNDNIRAYRTINSVLSTVRWGRSWPSGIIFSYSGGGTPSTAIKK